MGKFDRTKLLIGEENLLKLSTCKVAVFGIGGVGGYVIEALARSGVCNLFICDSDVIAESNINRQIIATESNLGRKKTSEMKDRLLAINPELNIEIFDSFVLPENLDRIDLSQFDYVVDAIDTVTTKIHLAKKCEELNVKLISSMGMGGKLDPTKLKVADIYETSECPLAKVMRHELKNLGVKKLKCVYSTEKPTRLSGEGEKSENGERKTPPSMIFVPASCGLLIAKEVVCDLIKQK